MPTTHRRRFLSTCSALVTTVASAGIVSGSNPPVATMKEEAKPAHAPEIGKPYQAWKEGELELHFILTGAAESMFHIYPDGTTMLLDAADRNTDAYQKNVPCKPDKSRLASEWIMRYLTRVNPGGRTIDYMMLSHYHEDHGGGQNVYAGKTEGRGDDYYLSGLANIGEYFTFNTVFDRGFPTYNQPVIHKADGYENFVRFTKYMREAGKFRQEEFVVGARDQIKLLKKPEQYPTFHTQNICRNGVVWTGEEGKNRDFYAENPETLKKTWLNENSLSLGLTIEYGPFRYFTGGDLSGKIVNDANEDQHLEGYVGSVVGKLDVCKTNHHSYMDAMTPEFTSAVRAHVYVSNVWDLYHLQDNTMTSMTTHGNTVDCASTDVLVCPTIIHPSNRNIFPATAPWQKHLAPEAWQGGHVVVKVFDDGRQYKVYYLTAEDESMTVQNVYGPFTSQG